MRFAEALLVAVPCAVLNSACLADSVCDRPNATVIMVRQENMIEVTFSLERDGNKMHGMARYSAGAHWLADRGPVNGEIGAKGGMYWQVYFGKAA